MNLCCLRWTFAWQKHINENKSSQAAEQLTSARKGGGKKSSKERGWSSPYEKLQNSFHPSGSSGVSVQWNSSISLCSSTDLIWASLTNKIWVWKLLRTSLLTLCVKLLAHFHHLTLGSLGKGRKGFWKDTFIQPKTSHSLQLLYTVEVQWTKEWGSTLAGVAVSAAFVCVISVCSHGLMLFYI